MQYMDDDMRMHKTRDGIWFIQTRVVRLINEYVVYVRRLYVTIRPLYIASLTQSPYSRPLIRNDQGET